MTKDLFKSGGSYFPPPPPPPLSPLLRAHGLLPRGAPPLDCMKKGSTSRRRDAPESLCTNSDHVFQAVKSVSKSPPLLLTDTARERTAWLLLQPGFRCALCAFRPRFLHTPRRQSELQPDWRQTNEARGSGRHRSPLLQLAEPGGAQNAERSAAETRTGSRRGRR